MGAPRIWSSLVLLFALVFAPAAQAEDHRAAVTAMMEKSGLRGQLANIGDTFRLGTLQSIEEGEEAFSEEQLAALADIGERSLEDPSFIQDIEAALADSLSASEIDAVSEFYASPLGQRIKAAELEASTPLLRR